MEEKDEDEKPTPGIVYLSRIPPFMNPLKIRTLLSQFGEVGRLFLQPEDQDVRKRRKKHGGSGRKHFTEGWIEFEDKKVAKSVASSINNTKIGGKKRYYYHDDIWNIKYLPKFKWGHISEKLAYEKAAREQRMRTEISQAKREASSYLENVGKGKAFAAMTERREKKRKLENNGEASEEKPEKVQKTMTHHQKTVVREKSSKSETSISTLNKSLLSKIFTSS